MPRRSSYEIVLDSGLFTPSQLQPVAVGRLAFQAGARWLRDHVCSHRMLISKHGVGMVLWALQLEYEEPLRFADADEVRLDVTARVRGPRSSQLEMEMTISGPAGVAVSTRATSVPLRLSGDDALSGVPAPLPDPVVGLFEEGERERSPYRTRVPGLRGTLERDGRHLGTTSTTFRLHRHHCEVADQWYWVESLGFAGAAREEYVMRHGRQTPELRRALSEGVRQVDVTWLRTGQLWDRIEIRTDGYQHGDDVAFVHQLRLAEYDGGPCAIVVERA